MVQATPTINLEDLLAGKIDGFNIDLGTVFAADDGLGTEDMDEITKRRDTLVASFHTMATDLFAQAAASAKEAKEAHAAQAARLEQKRRRTNDGEAAGGPLDAHGGAAPAAGATADSVSVAHCEALHVPDVRGARRRAPDGPVQRGRDKTG